MIAIRPIWSSVVPDHGQLRAEITELLAVERRIVDASKTYLKLSRVLWDPEYVDELEALMRSSHNDLIAGCEVARAGYLKQAYSLWRSWFEQSIFLLYFLEAPLHKAAWSVKAEISQDDSPRHKLMLHQLLAESSEKHPFALVYDARYTRLIEALKISTLPKAQRPITRASKVLTTLSQGVHGTYQPKPAQNMDGLCAQLEHHGTPVLESAEQIVNVFWILLLTNELALPEQMLIDLRDGKISAEALTRAGVDEAELVVSLAPFFSQAFPPPPPQQKK